MRYSWIIVGEKIEGKWVKSLKKQSWKLLLFPLNMAHVCVLSYSWVLFLNLSHTNLMSLYTPSHHLKSSPVITTLCLVISGWFNATKSLVIPSNVQGTLQYFLHHPTVLSTYHPCFNPYSFDLLITSSSCIDSCWWWGIHQGPPSMSIFMSNSTHNLGIRLKNHFVPWNLHTSMVGLLIFYS